MTSPVVTEVFRFLAVRPPQLVTDGEANASLIQDHRIADPVQKRLVTNRITELVDTKVAQQRWDNTNKDRVAILFQLHADVRNYYLELASRAGELGFQPPPAVEKLAELGNDGLGILETMNSAALAAIWDLLYTAYAIGNESGPEVAYPHSALQLHHFFNFLDGTPNPQPREALNMLDTTVLLSSIFPDAIAGGRRAQKERDEREVLAPEPPATKRPELVTLAHDIVAVNELIDAIRSSTGSGRANVRQRPVEKSDWNVRIEGGNLPTAADVIPEQLSVSQGRVLDGLQISADTTSVDAYEKLLTQAQKLNELATLVEDVPDFSDTYEKLMSSAKAVTLSSGQKISTSTAGVGVWGQIMPDLTGIFGYDMSGMIKPLGIGDLLVVKQTLLAYVAGEVAHIENVLHGEKKSRTHRRLDRTETTIFEATEENKESERDTQSTDRFELQDETSKTINSETNFDFGVTVTGRYGPVETTVTGNFASKNSKEESSKNSSKYAKEIVDKALVKIQSRIRSERTTKTITEVEEINIHSLEGKKEDGTHTVGIYRWVDKKYRAQVYNYGRRLLLEFVVPEPAAYYRSSWVGQTLGDVGVKPPPALLNYFDKNGKKNKNPEELLPEHIEEGNYVRYASMFGVTDIAPMPAFVTTVSSSLATPHIQPAQSFALKGEDKFAVPDGYSVFAITFGVSAAHSTFPKLAVHILGMPITLIAQPPGGMGLLNNRELAPHQFVVGGDINADKDIDEVASAQGPIATGLMGYDITDATATFTAYCKRTPRAEETWRLGIYKAIRTAWQTQTTVYEQAIKEAQQKQDSAKLFGGQNPGINKRVLETELKKHCINLMTGSDANTTGAISSKDKPPTMDPYVALQDGRISQFFEQAFEWEQMTYLFYPYFWGEKSRWPEYQSIVDTDPLFQSFLTAGAARVVIPVPLAYKNDVMYLLTNPRNEGELGKKVWGGGDMPQLDDPEYRSIAEELRDQTDDLHGATPEGEPWEFKTPTTLVWLQPNDELPSGMDA